MEKQAQYKSLSREALEALHKTLSEEYALWKGRNLSLDMSRGKPGANQLDLSTDLARGMEDFRTEAGFDVRNYGLLEGIPEARRLMGGLLGAHPDQVLVLGNSSLAIMYDTISQCMTHGVLGNTPWGQQGKVRFLCPVPGYDRHFGITEHFGIEMVNVSMTPQGPDMDQVRALVEKDDSIKGMWCVPKYSNPQGYTYSRQTVEALAALKPAAKDFRIFWDNAYAVHDLYEEKDALVNILEALEQAGNPDMAYVFGSTSKVSFAGAGLAAFASSPANVADRKKSLFYQTIGHDKVNQLRHVRYFAKEGGIEGHMRRHGDLLRPKFEKVEEILSGRLGGLGLGAWTKPLGGYFVSFSAEKGCAKAIVAKCKEAGLVLTPAGATYPYGMDPEDSNIRLAPSFPNLEEISQAMELFALCVKLVTVERLLEA